MTEQTKQLPGSSVVFMTDVSSVELDDTCPSKFYLSKLEGGTGIIKRSEIIPALLEAERKRDLRTLASMEDISPIAISDIITDVTEGLTVEDKLDVRRMELLYRRLGQLAAFALFLEPAIRQEFETIPLDSQLLLDRDPLWVIAYPDRLLKHKRSGEVILREYVQLAAGLTGEKWQQGWFYQPRLHVSLAAAIETQTDPTLQPKVAQAVGISQGFYSCLDNHLCHPFCYGYRNVITEEWVHSSAERKGNDWELRPVWEYPGGIVAWVRLCGESLVQAQFQLGPAVGLNEAILEGWVAHRIHREREIDAIKTGVQANRHLRGVYFPRRTSQCIPASGDSCSFKAACFGTNNPLDSKMYIPATHILP